MSNVINNDTQYAKWIKEINERFKRSQIKAACAVNEELLKFYWRLGRDISIKERKNIYGTDFFKKLSTDLQEELPDVKSFSVTNLRYMKYFYKTYPNAFKYPQVEETSDYKKNHPQLVDDLERLIFSIPWGHNRIIIDKCRGNHDKALGLNAVWRGIIL